MGVLPLEKSEGRNGGKPLSYERGRCVVQHAQEKYESSERVICRLLGHGRGALIETVYTFDKD